MTSIKKLSILLIIIIITTIIGSCQQVIENPLVIPQYVKKEPNYLTETITRRDIFSSTTIYAKVNAIQTETYTYLLSSGYVESILVERGQDVKKGDLLVTITDTDLIKDVRDIELSYEIEKLRVEKLSKTYELTGNGKYELDIALLDFQIIQFQYNQVIKKKEALNIYATFDGMVDSIRVTPNKSLIKGDPIIVIVDQSDTYLSFTDPQIAGLIEGTEVNVNLSSTEVIKATVIELNKKEKTVIIEPVSKDERLEKIGSIIRVEIITDQINNAIAVKESWIKEAAGRQFVYVLENGVMTEREISKGKTLGEWVEILLGLQEGDNVIINSN